MSNGYTEAFGVNEFINGSIANISAVKSTGEEKRLAILNFTRTVRTHVELIEEIVKDASLSQLQQFLTASSNWKGEEG